MEGLTASFSVKANGVHLSYQWQRDGSDIPGATDWSYRTELLTLADDGALYSCIVENSEGTATSGAATLTVYKEDKIYESLYLNSANRLTPYPCESSEYFSGLSQTFSGHLSGGDTITGAPVYVVLSLSAAAWIGSRTAVFRVALLKNGNILGSTATEIPEIDSYDSLNENWNRVTVSIIPSASISPSDNIEISISSVGDADNIRKLGISPDNPEYSKIYFPIDETTLVSPTIISSPDHLTVMIKEGVTATFSVEVSGLDLSYQWQQDGVDIPGATGLSYTIESVTLADSGSVYWCIGSNSAGSVISEAATLTVLAKTMYKFERMWPILKQPWYFDAPEGIALDESGHVYVVDSNNHRIQKFTSDGVFIKNWGSQGSGDGQFNSPTGIAIDESGHVYVTDTSNDRIQKFTSNGAFRVCLITRTVFKPNFG